MIAMDVQIALHSLFVGMGITIYECVPEEPNYPYVVFMDTIELTEHVIYSDTTTVTIDLEIYDLVTPVAFNRNGLADIVKKLNNLIVGYSKRNYNPIYIEGYSVYKQSATYTSIKLSTATTTGGIYTITVELQEG